MPLIDEKRSFVGDQEVKFKAQGNEAFQTQSNFNQAQNEPQKGLISLPPALMQIIPWIPFALEAMTGQKIPQIGGTIGEIQSSLQQMQFSLTQLLNNQQQILSGQQQLWNKLESLESSASNQLTSLKEQVVNTSNSFKLLATETKRSLEFQAQPKELESN